MGSYLDDHKIENKKNIMTVYQQKAQLLTQILARIIVTNF